MANLSVPIASTSKLTSNQTCWRLYVKPSFSIFLKILDFLKKKHGQRFCLFPSKLRDEIRSRRRSPRSRHCRHGVDLLRDESGRLGRDGRNREAQPEDRGQYHGSHRSLQSRNSGFGGGVVAPGQESPLRRARVVDDRWQMRNDTPRRSPPRFGSSLGAMLTSA